MKHVLVRIFKLPYFPIIVSPLILLSPVIFSGKALFWGTPSLQFIPWWVWSFESLLAGKLPLWNPLLGMGAPLVANYQSALFYPPNWLYFFSYVIGDISLLTWMQAVLVVIHLVLAGLGMVILTRKMGLSRIAQTVSSLAFSLSGFLVARAWFASINASVAWLPWILVCVYDLAHDGDQLKSVVKLGLVSGIQFLAGHAQTSWYTLLLAVIFYWFMRFNQRESEGLNIQQRALKVGKEWFLFGMAILLGVGIASVQLIPTIEYLLQSQRASAVEYDAAMTYSMWPWRLLGLIAPNLFGNPVYGNYWGYGNFWEDSIYIGLVPLLLSLLSFIRIFSNRRGEDARAGFSYEDKWDGILSVKNNNFESSRDNLNNKNLSILLLFLCILSILFALGKNTPIFPWLYNHIPTFNLFHSPTRFSIWLVFSLSVSAGIGMDYWKRPDGKGLYWTRLATAGAFAVILGAGLGWLLLKDVVQDFHPTFVTAFALAGIVGIGAGILSLTKPKDIDQVVSKSVMWEWGLVFWVCLDLIFAGWGLNPGIDIKFYTIQIESIIPLHEMLGEGRVYLSPGDEYDLKYDVFFTFSTFETSKDWESLRASLLPNLNLLEKIPFVNNYDPLIPAKYAVWMEKLNSSEGRIREKIFDFMNVSVLESRSETSKHGVRFEGRGVTQRVRWVPCYRAVASEKDALNLIFDGKVNLMAEVLIVTENKQEGKACYIPDFVPEISINTGNRVTVEIETSTEGWIVLADTWYPGWRVMVDGEIKEVEQGNYAFMTVEVPKGNHEVTFFYQPLSFILGSIISTLSIIFISLILILIEKRINKVINWINLILGSRDFIDFNEQGHLICHPE